MKNRRVVLSLVSGAFALLILSSYAKQEWAEAINPELRPAGDARIRATGDEEEHHTYRLTAGAHIDVSNISGPVSIQATGGWSAEVSIYRTAPNPDDLAHRKVSVEQTSSGLTIRQKNDGTETFKINLLNRVVLKLPRQVSVSGRSISGDFIIDGISGAIDLNGISGNADVRHFNGSLTVSGVSGNVHLAIDRLNDAGMRVNSVSGNVYLQLARNLNGELSVSNTSGGVSNGIEGLAVAKDGTASYSARLGSGESRIVVSNVTGAVILRQRRR